MASRLTLLGFALALSLAAGAHAREPGTPMDCSDVELTPGLTCTEATRPEEENSFSGNAGTVVDNDGRHLFGGGLGELVGSCGLSSLRRQPLLVAAHGDGSRTLLVSAVDRCLDPSTRHVEQLRSLGVTFDPVRGEVFLTLGSSCSPDGAPGCPYRPGGGGSTLDWTARISGFTPLADVLPPPTPRCSNGIDDDGDGDVDLEDDHCKSEADNDESRP